MLVAAVSCRGRQHSHQRLELVGRQELVVVLANLQNDLGTAAQSVATGVWEDLKGVALGVGHKDILLGFGVLLGRCWKRSNADSRGYEERRVESET